MGPPRSGSVVPSFAVVVSPRAGRHAQQEASEGARRRHGALPAEVEERQGADHHQHGHDDERHEVEVE
eukprot:12851313-Alexandrium_andersonii.AAC.1